MISDPSIFKVIEIHKAYGFINYLNVVKFVRRRLIYVEKA